jgi:hypothetical protein
MFICKNNKKVKDFFMDVYIAMKSKSDYYANFASDQTAAHDVLAKQKISYGFLDDRFTTFGVLRSDHNLLWTPGVGDFVLPRDMLAFHANYTIGVENKMKLLEYVRSVKLKRTRVKKPNLPTAE